MSILQRMKRLFGGGIEPSPPPPGSPPGEGVAISGGDASKPAYEGKVEMELDPPIREAPKPGKAGGGAP